MLSNIWRWSKRARDTSNVTPREPFKACMTGGAVVTLTEEQDGGKDVFIMMCS